MRLCRALFVSFLIISLTTGVGCKGESTEVLKATKPVSLEIWGVFDDSDAYGSIISDYRAIHPYVNVSYRKLRPEEYEKELTNALAEDRGPDIFMLHNTWIRAWQPRIEPMPSTVSLAEQVMTGTVKKELTYEIRQKSTISLKNLQNSYPDQVARDVVIETDVRTGPTTSQVKPTVFGLPLSIDTLALYYNRDLFNAAGLAEPPKTWTEFQEAVRKLVKLDSSGNVIRAGAAIGNEKNIERPTDILTLLMMQNGTQMVTDGGVTMNRFVPGVEAREYPPGLEATIFYTDFANPNKEVYTWNDSLPNALDAFVTGQSAMFLGYNYHLPTIRARAPKLKFGIAPAPQIPPSPEVNFASYWFYTVSKKSENSGLAWDFINFMTSENEAKKYLAVTKKPTALRTLIKDQSEDPDIGVFASQILTAQNWYSGYNVAAAEDALRDLIDGTLQGGDKLVDLMNTVTGRVSQTFSPGSRE